MIIGIGTDIVSIERIKDSVKQHEQRFLDRCFTNAEQKIANTKYSDEEQQITYYAKRWAAKEACAKAFGTGIGETIGFQDIDVSRQSEAGKPIITITDKSKRYLQDMHLGKTIQIEVSLSDEKDFALAFVVISVE